MIIVVHHNPDCGTSRNVLRIIAASVDAASEVRSFPARAGVAWRMQELRVS